MDETFCTNSASQIEKSYKKSKTCKNISVENLISSFEDINIHNFRTHKSVSYWDSIGNGQVKKKSPLCWKTSDSCKMGNSLGNCSCDYSEMANLQQKQKIEVIMIDTSSSDSDAEAMDWSSSTSEDEIQITKIVRVSRRDRQNS